MQYHKRLNTQLDAWVHTGFDIATIETINHMRPHLKADYNYRITGHSLGGAMTLLLGMHLDKEGFKVKEITTFGQPMVTNEECTKKFSHLPILRVINSQDTVPLVPPLTLVSAQHGKYRHFGEEVWLLKDTYYIELDKHVSGNEHINSLWDNFLEVNVSDHYMASYLKRIAPKINGAPPVGSEERSKFLN